MPDPKTRGVAQTPPAQESQAPQAAPEPNPAEAETSAPQDASQASQEAAGSPPPPQMTADPGELDRAAHDLYVSLRHTPDHELPGVMAAPGDSFLATFLRFVTPTPEELAALKSASLPVLKLVVRLAVERFGFALPF